MQHAVRRHERAAVFEKEGTLLRKERLEHAQVEHRRVLFDLPEVRVDRCRERRPLAETQSQIGAARDPSVAGRAAARCSALPSRYGISSIAPGRHNWRVEHEVAKERRLALFAARLGDPRAQLALAADLTSRIQVPRPVRDAATR